MGGACSMCVSQNRGCYFRKQRNFKRYLEELPVSECVEQGFQVASAVVLLPVPSAFAVDKFACTVHRQACEVNTNICVCTWTRDCEKTA
jgi:hypothetical protein